MNLTWGEGGATVEWQHLLVPEDEDVGLSGLSGIPSALVGAGVINMLLYPAELLHEQVIIHV